MRATAGGQPGIVTRTGLHTFVDPRYEGGRINEATREDIVQVITLEGQEYLFYKTHPIDVAIIRGSSADAEGNLTMEEEVGTFAMLSMAQAARCNRGLVIAQVKRINRDENALPVQVKVPGVLIDAIVVEPEQSMTFLTDHDPALIRRDAPFEDEDLFPEGIARVVAKRAACELYSGAYVNLGYGMSDGVPLVARREGVLHSLIFLIEQGATAGIPTTGLNFGAMYNPAAILDDGYQFDFFQGGGLDLAFLGFAQVDQHGNVNSSRFAGRITGCGGAIDISQNARKVVFCGTFAAKAKVAVTDGKLRISDPGQLKKFVPQADQITFNGQYAFSRGQEVLYCTERAVFRLTGEGIELTEIAPGIRLEEDILSLMDFRPKISGNLRTMQPSLFTEDLIGLQEKFSPFPA
jgi:propionate CoA-transferase